jgi:hypothetical protein
MTKVEDTTQTPNDESKNQRGKFPRLALKKVIELTTAIYEEGHGDPVRRRTVFEKLKKSPESSTSYYLIQAANTGYSLIKGSKTSTHLELTGLADTLSNVEVPEAKRIAAIYELLFGNLYFSALVEKYKDRPLPSDTIVVDYLIRDQKLSQKDAEAFWSTAKENLNDFNLIEETGNKKIVIDKDYALKKMGIVREEAAQEAFIDTEVEKPKQVDVIDESSNLSKTKKMRNLPQITFNIQVVLPENASPEVYDSIFSSMSTHLLGKDEE